MHPNNWGSPVHPDDRGKMKGGISVWVVATKEMQRLTQRNRKFEFA